MTGLFKQRILHSFFSKYPSAELVLPSINSINFCQCPSKNETAIFVVRLNDANKTIKAIELIFSRKDLLFDI